MDLSYKVGSKFFRFVNKALVRRTNGRIDGRLDEIVTTETAHRAVKTKTKMPLVCFSFFKSVTT